MSTVNFTDQLALAPSLYGGAHGVDPHYAGHVVQFYTDDAFVLDGLTRFIGIALAAGEAAIVIATEAHREGLTQRLKARGVDPARAFATGRFIPLDATETLSKLVLNGTPDAGRFTDLTGSMMAQATAAAEGDRPRVAAFGEMVALLWEQGKPEAAIRLEELWNDLARTHCFSLRCAYPMHRFDREEHGESFLKICAAHGGVIPDDNYTTVVTEDHRSRVIATLQQKAQALATEIAERKRVEEELRRAKADLESLVAQRTSGFRTPPHRPRITRLPGTMPGRVETQFGHVATIAGPRGTVGAVGSVDATVPG